MICPTVIGVDVTRVVRRDSNNDDWYSDRRHFNPNEASAQAETDRLRNCC